MEGGKKTFIEWIRLSKEKPNLFRLIAIVHSPKFKKDLKESIDRVFKIRSN